MTEAVNMAPKVDQTPSILSLIAFDVASFIALFGFFMFDRSRQPLSFAQSAGLLDVRLGALNTLILITSGWLVASAVEAARHVDLKRTSTRLIAATLVGSGFAIVKIIEYGAKLKAGITPYTNDFFAYYYMLTGIHLFHFAIGIFLLLLIIRKTKKRMAVTPDYMNWLRSCAVYWHMVDLLWIFLFPMLYLQGVR